MLCNVVASQTASRAGEEVADVYFHVSVRTEIHTNSFHGHNKALNKQNTVKCATICDTGKAVC